MPDELLNLIFITGYIFQYHGHDCNDKRSIYLDYVWLAGLSSSLLSVAAPLFPSVFAF